MNINVTFKSTLQSPDPPVLPGFKVYIHSLAALACKYAFTHGADRLAFFHVLLVLINAF